MIKKLIFLIFISIGLSTEWGTSFSVRTPNDVNKEFDYEFMTKIEKTDGYFTYLFKKDWERELVNHI